MLASQLPPDSPLMIHASKGDSVWQLEHQLLAGIYDATAAGNWQRGGGKGRKPKPVKRPGVGGTSEQFGSGRSRDELDDLIEATTGRRPGGQEVV